MRRSMRGFTLIEILIVVFIIGLTASLIALSIGDDKTKHPPFIEAQTFLQTIDFIAEYAALNGDTIGMFIEPKNVEESAEKQWCYSWKRLRDRNWADLPEDSSRQHCMDVQVEWELEIEGRLYEYDPDLETQPPVLIFSSSGESTPVEMSIYDRETSDANSEPQHIVIDMMGGTCWAENPKLRDPDKKGACNVR
ncbi:MAG: prepilin-type N-terminal cleavage/methylation domain-containing protein [Gammaproteobacteria bacterium]|nr:MAG: prepilin-type N-terminal cleavage/methylation domain-containing protein [Gammaproteobacteria bacterium]